jgi:hypothetical protein
MPAKKNCASAWENHTAGRSAQNGGSPTDTLDTSVGGELSAASMLTRGHQCGMSIFTATTTYHCNKFFHGYITMSREAKRRAYPKNAGDVALKRAVFAAGSSGPERGRFCNRVFIRDSAVFACG